MSKDYLLIFYLWGFTATPSSDSGIKPEDQAILIGIVAVALYLAFGKQVFDLIDKTKLFFTNSFISLKLWVIDAYLFFTTLKGILILLAIFSPLILYFNYKWNNAISASLRERRIKKQRLELTEERIKKLLNADLEKLDVHQLWRYIESIRDELDEIEDTQFEKKYQDDLYQRLSPAKRLHEIKKHESRIKGYQVQEKQYEELLDLLEDERQSYNREQKKEKRKIYNKLYLQDTPVFYKEELSEEECEILKEHNYKQVNEYDIFSKNVRTFLVKCPLNHSPTHTFLVWSMKKLLEDTKNVERIEQHLTRDADITFRYKKKYYALEIETGNLLSKKTQLQQKVLMLNRKYGNRWMFVVSNKEDLPKYRKWGRSTQRTEIEKVLEKWLE